MAIKMVEVARRVAAFFFLGTLSCVFHAASHAADLYKCVDAKGVVTYGNTAKAGCTVLSVGKSPDAADASVLGTIEVEFQPMQSAGVRHGCTLVYRTIGRDHAYQKGAIVGLVGNIGFMADEKRSSVIVTLKVGIIDGLTQSKPKTVTPFFAYLQTPNGTTAKSKVIKFDSDTPGYRNFAYQLTDDVLKVYGDIVNGEPLTIGYNRKKGGLDVLVPLDLSVADATSSDSGFTRRRSDKMLGEFLACSNDVTTQVQNQLERGKAK